MAVRKRLLSDERRAEIKKNFLGFLKNAAIAILPFLVKKVEDKTGVDIPEIPIKDQPKP